MVLDTNRSYWDPRLLRNRLEHHGELIDYGWRDIFDGRRNNKKRAFQMMAGQCVPVEDARRMRRNCCPQVHECRRKTIFSREDGSLVECAVCGTVLENLKRIPKVPGS